MAGKLITIIEKYLHKKEEKKRDYIGASGIGSDCLRKIWYEYNLDEKPIANPKLQITWLIGKTLEEFILNLMINAGIDIGLPNKTNNFFEFSDSQYPYFKGHCDAILIKPKKIIEIKTAKDASFKILLKNGLLKWNKTYYTQLQCYMGMSQIHKSIIIVLNKDTSELYEEEIIYNQDYYERVREIARMIYETKIIPPRINNSPLWYQCKMCQFREICHK